MARLIGAAYISILPDFDTFRAKADAGIKKGLAGLNPQVPVGADTSRAKRDVAKFDAEASKMGATVPVDADTRKALADIARMEAELKSAPLNLNLDVPASTISKLRGEAGTAFTKSFDIRAAIPPSSLAAMRETINAALKGEKADVGVTVSPAQLAKMRGTLDMFLRGYNVDFNIMPAQGSLAKLLMESRVLANRLRDMPADLDIRQAEAKYAALLAQAGHLRRAYENLPMDINTGPALAKLGLVNAALDRTDRKLSEVSGSRFMASLGTGAFTASLARAATLADVMATHMRDVGHDTGIATAMLERLAATNSMWIASGTGGWGILNGQIRLFGGALERFMPQWLADVHLWHLGADAIFEFAAAWAPALIAVGTFAAYAIPIGQKFYGQWKNINTLLDGVNAHMSAQAAGLHDLGGAFDQIEKMIEPSLVIAFGEAMQMVTRNATPLGSALQKVGGVIDKFGAAAVAWSAQAQKGFAKIVSTGAGDFALLGDSIHHVFAIIANLIKDMPGYVHILLSLGDGALRVTSSLVQMLGPVLKVGLALHGFIVYVGLAVTGILTLGRAMVIGGAARYMTMLGRESTAAGQAAALGAGKFSKFGVAIGNFGGMLAGAGVMTWKYGASLVALSREQGLAAGGSRLLGDGLARIPGITRNADGTFKVLRLTMSGGALAAAGLTAAVGVALVGALVYMAVKVYNAKDAMQRLDAQMQKLIASSITASEFQQNVTLAIVKTTQAVNKNSLELQRLTGSATATSKALTQMGPAAVNPVTGGFSALGNKINTASASINQGRAAISGYVGTAQVFGQRMNVLSNIFGSNAAAQQAMNAVGIRTGDIATENTAKFQEQVVELKALANGYGYMNQSGSAATNQLAELNIATGTTTKNIQTLTQAESQWITMITSGDQAFTTFEQQQNTLVATMRKGTSATNTLTVRVGNLRQRLTVLGTSLNGTSSAALAARQAFDQQLQAGQTLYGNLQTLAAASGNTSAAQHQLAQSGKDVIAQLLPLASGSKEAQAQVYALAQTFGYTGKNTLPGLVKWLGHTRNAEHDLNIQQAKLTESAANVTTAMKNLGNVLSGDISSLQAQAIIKTNGLAHATEGLAHAAQTARGALTRQAQVQAGAYYTSLLKAGVGTSQAKQYLDAYMRQLGFSRQAIAAMDSKLAALNAQQARVNGTSSKAAGIQHALASATAANLASFSRLVAALPGGIHQVDGLWRALLREDAAMVRNGLNSNTVKAQFIEFAVNGLHLTTAKANELWNKFGHQNLDVTAGKAAATKREFIHFAMDGLHLTADKATALWRAFALQNLDMLMARGEHSKAVFIDFARHGLDLTTSAANTLWNTMRRQYLDTVSHKAGMTQGAFERVAEKLGYTKHQADELWASLKKMSGQYGVNVKAHVGGGGKVSATVSVSAATAAITQGGAIPGIGSPPQAGVSSPGQLHKFGHHAAGGVIHGGVHGIDSVPAMLAPGELIIPSTHAPKFADMARRASIPGFAAGGIIGDSTTGRLGGNGLMTAQFTGNPGEMSRAGQELEPGLPRDLIRETSKVAPMVVQELVQAIQAVQSQVNMASAGIPGGVTAGTNMANLLTIARYLMGQGLTRAAAAGIAGTIAGESGGNPESVGSGGFGLIGWTGNTIGLPPGYHGPTGNASYDLAAQMAGIIGYMNSRGGRGPLNAAGNPVAAGNVWSRYEAPLVPLSDTRPGVAMQIFSELGGTQGPVAGSGQNWTPGKGGGGKTGLGMRILMDAERYNGHPYHWGGASNPSRGWDCSSFASWVLGHDLGLSLPGGSWASTTGGGQSHGDTASQFMAMPGAVNMGHNPGSIQPGDILVWPGHVGFGVGPGRMFSAFSTASGTIFSPASASGQMTIMRMTGAGGFGATMPGPITDRGTFGFNFARGGLVGDLGAGGFKGMSMPERKALMGAINFAGQFNAKHGFKPHSAGGMISEPVYGTGAYSGLPYSFAEHGAEQIVPGGKSTQGPQHMQAMTALQGAQLLQCVGMMVKLLSGMPYAYAKAQQQANSQGALHGYYSARH